MSIRVALVDDHEPTRTFLAALIGGTRGFECVGAYPDAGATLKRLPVDRPEVMLVDLELPGTSGTELIKVLRERKPAVEIMVLTVHDEPDYLFDALKAGATGYLLKDEPPAKILEGIAEVRAGGSPMSSQIARRVLRTFHTQGRVRSELDTLTDREEDVLARLCEGFRYREIAKELGISPRTIGSHVHHIYGKLHVRSATEAARKYYDARGPSST